MEDYCFVKISRDGSRPVWLFSPQSEEQVNEHFKRVFLGEVVAGIVEHIEKSITVLAGGRPGAAVTPWCGAVDRIARKYTGDWNAACDALMKSTMDGRLKAFADGEPVLLADGVEEAMMRGGDRILETVFRDTLEYPSDI